MSLPEPETLAEFDGEIPENLIANADYMISQCEYLRLGWSLDHTGNLIEARIWNWPWVIGRYRPREVEPLAKMLWMALRDAKTRIENGTTAYA